MSRGVRRGRRRKIRIPDPLQRETTGRENHYIAKVARWYGHTPKQFKAMATKEGMTWKEYWQGLRGDALLPGLPNERKEARSKLYQHCRSGSSFPLQNRTS